MNVFDHLHSDEEIETVRFKEHYKIRACVSQSNVKASASCQSVCGLGTLSSATFSLTLSRFSTFIGVRRFI